MYNAGFTGIAAMRSIRLLTVQPSSRRKMAMWIARACAGSGRGWLPARCRRSLHVACTAAIELSVGDAGHERSLLQSCPSTGTTSQFRQDHARDAGGPMVAQRLPFCCGPVPQDRRSDAAAIKPGSAMGEQVAVGIARRLESAISRLMLSMRCVGARPRPCIMPLGEDGTAADRRRAAQATATRSPMAASSASLWVSSRGPRRGRLAREGGAGLRLPATEPW